MYNNNLKTIAVFASDMQDTYNRGVCHNISLRAKELGYNVAIFHWNNPYGQRDEYLKGEASIFKMFDYSSIDAAIYIKDVFNNETVESLIDENLQKYVHGPKVSLRLPIEGFYNIVLNDAVGIRDIIKHFIEDHGCRKIAYMSGKRHMRDTQLRLATYKEVMAEYNIPYDDSYIFHGDYWTEKGKDAVNQFLSSPLGVPEVIVCANDYMAFSVMDALIEKGYKIPEDIMVSGFDNMINEKEYMPSLTTADVPLDVLGNTAVDIIDDVLCGRGHDENTYIDAVMIKGESCGCISDDNWNNILRHVSHDDQMEDKLLSRNIRLFTVALQDTDSLADIIDVVDNHMHINGKYNNFFLCLSKDYNCDETSHIKTENKDYDSEMICAFSMLNRANLFREPFLFDSNTLIPSCYITDEPQIYYFSAIHFLENVYGYTAISFYDYKGLYNDYYSFTIYIGNALADLLKKQELERTLRELEKLYISDALTGLFNRRGFEFKAQQFFGECTSNKIPFAFMTIDMDGLKYINDTYGHMQGDIAICALADAMKYASCGNEICARVGGDEFDVFAKGYTKEDAERFIKKMYEYLSIYNNKSETEYAIDASYGIVTVSENIDNQPLEYYMKLGDVRMYKNKASKKHKRI